jgi:mannose-6-phosphate isomerase-like protein (cupin superfamily)
LRKSLTLAVCLLAGAGASPGAAEAPKITVTDVDRIVYVVRGKAKARLGDEQREVSPGDRIATPKRVPHRFDQIGSEPFVILVNATPGWDPLADTKFLE